MRAREGERGKESRRQQKGKNLLSALAAIGFPDESSIQRPVVSISVFCAHNKEAIVVP
jgi:hypothetical protein